MKFFWKDRGLASLRLITRIRVMWDPLRGFRVLQFLACMMNVTVFGSARVKPEQSPHDELAACKLGAAVAQLGFTVHQPRVARGPLSRRPQLASQRCGWPFCRLHIELPGRIYS